MTSTSETPPGLPPGPPPYPGALPPPPPSRPRLLRRSESNRVAAGVAGGLGEYFGVDPVLFRVLFAVTAFFGGVGILVYIVAWAAIPDRTAQHAPIDRLLGSGRQSNIPVWILTIVAVAVAWGLLFSWWAPWKFLPWMFVPLLLAALVLAVALSRRPPESPTDAAFGQAAAGLGQSAASFGQTAETTQPTQPLQPPQSADQTQPAGPPAWLLAARERRRRSAPVRLATLLAITVGLGIAGVIDGMTGIALPVYFWIVEVGLLGGLIVGAILRRPFWLGTLLLIPGAIGLFVFAGSRASLHDGSGDNVYTPQTAAQLRSDYHHAFGRTTLDLTTLHTPDAAHTVHVRLAAGQVRLLVPPSLPVNVHADIHLGDVRIDGRDDSSGMGLHTDPITTTSAQALNIDVQISAGELRIERSP